jgi:hypothetical protein
VGNYEIFKFLVVSGGHGEGKKKKRWEIRVGEKGRWVHGKTSLINYRYHCD